jgi:hypothetical protein
VTGSSPTPITTKELVEWMKEVDGEASPQNKVPEPTGLKQTPDAKPSDGEDNPQPAEDKGNVQPQKNDRPT